MWFQALARRLFGTGPVKTATPQPAPSFLPSTQPLEPPPPGPGPSAPERRELEPGQVLAGRFRVLSFVARGGMGEVYAAEDLRAGGSVALKTIRGEGASSLEMLQRFRREVEHAKRVTSPHVCRIYDIHYHDPGRHPEYTAREPAHPVMFLTMEFLEGETLSHSIRRRGPMPPGEALNIFRQIVAGLEAVHSAGIIHRDLKSGNIILVRPREENAAPVVKITDFGLARRLHREQTESSFTEIGKFVGTPEYMAPEVLGQVQPATVESDIYSLGVVMYQVLTGQLPVSAGRSGASPTPPSAFARDIPKSWDAIILRCVDTHPAKRFHAASDVLRSLDRPSRKPAAVWAAAVFVCAAALVAYLWLRAHPKNADSVAVFGFKNLTGDPALGNVSDALQVGISSELRVGKEIPVVPGEDIIHLRHNLGLSDAESYSPATLNRIRANTGAKLVIHGSYWAGGESPGNTQLRLYVTIEDTGSGGQTSFREVGSAADLDPLISHVVNDLRAQWHLPPRSAQEQQAAASALPTSSEALRLYSEGVRTMNTFDSPAARTLFEQAIAIEPAFAPAHAELAEVLNDLGRDTEARAEAERALELSKALPREQRLLIEGEYYDVTDQWQKAIERFQTLFNWDPGNLYYGLLLASVQTGRPEVFKTIDRLRKLPPPLRDDPRIDIREAIAESSSSNYAAEARIAAVAADKARRLGARGQVAESLSLEAQAENELGHHDRARQLYQDAMDLNQALHDELSAAGDARSLALLKLEEGDLAGAAAQVNQALEVARRFGSYVAEARGVNALGSIRLAQGRLEEASKLFQRTLALWRKANNELNTGVAEMNLGITLHQRGLVAEAETDLNGAVSLLQNSGPRFRALALGELASIEIDRRNFTQARKLLDQAFRIEHNLSEMTTLPRLLMTAGKLARVTGALDESASQYSKALDVSSRSGQAGVAALARLGRAEVDLDRETYDIAEAEARQALSEFEREGRAIDAAYARAVAALCIAGRGDNSAAQGMLAPAIQAAAKLEAPEAREFIRSARARIQTNGRR